MVLGLVQRGEVVPVGFDLRPIGDVKSRRAENAFDALPGTYHRVNATAAAASPRQRYVQGFLRQTGIERLCLNGIAARGKSRLDLLLCLIDQRTDARPFPCGEPAETFQLFGERAGLAEKARLRLFEPGSIADPLKRGARFGDDLFQVVHGSLPSCE